MFLSVLICGYNSLKVSLRAPGRAADKASAAATKIDMIEVGSTSP